MNVHQIITELSKLSKSDLRQVNERTCSLIRQINDRDTAIKAMTLYVGAKVSWFDRRHGTMHGTVMKIKRKNADVRRDTGVPGQRWTCAMSLLRLEKGA